MEKSASPKVAELTDGERKEILEFLSAQDTEILKATAEAISMMVRAFEGRPIDSKDAIYRLTNVQNIRERSRFPTYPIVQKQVFLNLIALLAPKDPETDISVADSCALWSRLDAETLISYKGESRKEFTDQMKAASAASPDAQNVFFSPGGQPEPTPKKRFWQRRDQRKKQESEFVE